MGVLLAEPLLAAGVRQALAADPGLALVPVRSDAWRAADVVVADLANALRIAAADRMARPRGAGTHVVVLAGEGSEADVRRALASGVRGYLVADCEPGELLQAVRTVCAGGRHLCAAVARCLAESLAHDPLTQRERDVLDLLADGRCNKAIAAGLGISPGTVKAHVKSIFSKLDARSRTQAARIALQRGMVRR